MQPNSLESVCSFTMEQILELVFQAPPRSNRWSSPSLLSCLVRSRYPERSGLGLGLITSGDTEIVVKGLEAALLRVATVKRWQQFPLLVFLPVAIFATQPVPALAVPSDLPKDRPVSDKWALIVGISKFQQRTLPELRYAAKDAKDFRDFLVTKGNFAPDHVRLLLNEKATRKQILSSFDKFLGRVARKDDLVVVYFSTHGSPETADSRGRSYLISHDADKEDLFASAIPMSDIMELVRERITSDRVLLVMDTCFSGATVAPGSKSVDEVGNLDAAKIAQGSGQLVICSSSPKERSWESRRYTNGIFTKKLIDALRANGPKTKLHNAFNAVVDEVENEVREDQGIRQHPVLAAAGWKGEDLMLAAPAATPRPLPEVVQQLLDPDSSQNVEQNFDRSIVRTTEASIPAATPPAILSTPTTSPPPSPTVKASPPSTVTADSPATKPVAQKAIDKSRTPAATPAPPGSKKTTAQEKKVRVEHTNVPALKSGQGAGTSKDNRPSKPPPPVAPLWLREPDR